MRSKEQDLLRAAQRLQGSLKVSVGKNPGHMFCDKVMSELYRPSLRNHD